MNDLKGIIEDCNKSDLVSNKVIKKIIEIIGQEEWQDLHDENNDICTTMGELIITLKGIAELEEAKANLEYLLEGRDNEIDELKKENKVLAQNLEDTEICENGWKNRIEKMKSQYDYAFNQLCESREIVCLMLSQYKNKEEIDYSTRERGEKLLKQGVYKYD